MTIRKLEIIPVELEVKLQLATVLTDIHNGIFDSAITFLEQCNRGRAAVKRRIISADEEVDKNCYRYSLLLKEMPQFELLFRKLAERWEA